MSLPVDEFIYKVQEIENERYKRRPLWKRFICMTQEMFALFTPLMILMYLMLEHKALRFDEHSNLYIHALGVLCAFWWFLNISYKRRLISEGTLFEMAEYLRIERAKEENMARMIRDKYGEL